MAKTGWLVAILVGVALFGYRAEAQGWYHDRAVANIPYHGFTALTAIPYGQVRICSLPVNSGVSPCTPLAPNITDQYGNLLTVQGGNFGQVTTDVTGQFAFGCTLGNYEIQVAAAASNTPALQYNVSCPVPQPSTGNNGGLYNAPVTTGFTNGNTNWQNVYSYQLQGNLLSTVGGIEVTCGVATTSNAGNLRIGLGGQYLTTIGNTVGNASNMAHAVFFNKGTTNTQWGNMEQFASPAGGGTPFSYMTYDNTLTVDTTNLQTVTCDVFQNTGGQWQGFGFTVARAQQ